MFLCSLLYEPIENNKNIKLNNPQIGKYTYDSKKKKKTKKYEKTEKKKNHPG